MPTNFPDACQKSCYTAATPQSHALWLSVDKYRYPTQNQYYIGIFIKLTQRPLIIAEGFDDSFDLEHGEGLGVGGGVEVGLC